MMISISNLMLDRADCCVSVLRLVSFLQKCSIIQIFAVDRDHTEMWQFYDNTGHGNFCGRDNVLLGGQIPGLDVTISTKDFVPVAGFMIQYTV